MTSVVDPKGFYRIDKTTWSMFQTIGDKEYEFRFKVPLLKQNTDQIALLKTLEAVVSSRSEPFSMEKLRRGLTVRIQQKGLPSIKGYKMRQQKGPSVLTRLFRSIARIYPYFYSTIQSKKIVTITVSKPSLWNKLVCKVCRIQQAIFRYKANELESPVLRFTGTSFLDQGFTDPFTQLSAWCFQKIEPHFVMEKEHRGTHRLALSDIGEHPQLHLKRITKQASDQIIDENRRTVEAYRRFLEEEHGQEVIGNVKQLCGVDLDFMLQEGLALLPDHVFKCNIAVNSIEMPHVEALWEKLENAYSVLKKIKKRSEQWDETKRTTLASLEEIQKIFTVRELRGLNRVITEKQKAFPVTQERLLTFLETLVIGHQKRSFRDLPEEVSSSVISMLMPTDEELDTAFTGRKIRHIEVKGYHSMGHHDRPNPCRLIFELLHTHKDLRKTNDWQNFFELASHTLSKKALYRPPGGSHKEEMRAGLILPGPSGVKGEKRWYYNQAFLDDSQGKVTYLLLPVAKGAKDRDGTLLPCIKLYRSTASSKSALNSLDSIRSDLHPVSSPNSLKPDLENIYHNHYLAERTIPLWVAYYLADQRSQSGDIRIVQAGVHFINYLKERSPGNSTLISEITGLLKNDSIDELRAELKKWGDEFEEFPEYKIKQPIVFCGHSLGGGLAQWALHYLSAHAKRVPPPGQTCSCYAYNAPAIDSKDDKEFMAFGKEHKEIFELLGIQWEIYHQFEHRDVVPHAGCNHLGTTRYSDKDRFWLRFSAVVFKPLPTAESLSIAGERTCHERMISRAQEGRDFSVSKISAKELFEHDTSWWISKKVAEIFGYRYFRSPRIGEALRRVAGIIAYLPLKILSLIRGDGIGRRSSDGVLSIDYKQ